MYGETRQIRPYETRRYQVSLEIIPTGQLTYEELGESLRKKLKAQVEGWFLADRQTDLEGSEA
jgi:hypothetical protein